MKVYITAYLILENGKRIKHEFENPIETNDIELHRKELKEKHNKEIDLIYQENPVITNP